MSKTRSEQNLWTIVTRDRGGKFFRPVAGAVSTTWEEAVVMANAMSTVVPSTTQVYYTADEAAQRSGYVVAEDIDNILSDDGKKRTTIKWSAEPKYSLHKCVRCGEYTPSAGNNHVEIFTCERCYDEALADLESKTTEEIETMATDDDEPCDCACHLKGVEPIPWCCECTEGMPMPTDEQAQPAVEGDEEHMPARRSTTVGAFIRPLEYIALNATGITVKTNVHSELDTIQEGEWPLDQAMRQMRAEGHHYNLTHEELEETLDEALYNLDHGNGLYPQQICVLFYFVRMAVEDERWFSEASRPTRAQKRARDSRVCNIKKSALISLH